MVQQGVDQNSAGRCDASAKSAETSRQLPHLPPLKHLRQPRKAAIRLLDNTSPPPLSSSSRWHGSARVNSSRKLPSLLGKEPQQQQKQESKAWAAPEGSAHSADESVEKAHEAACPAASPRPPPQPPPLGPLGQGAATSPLRSKLPGIGCIGVAELSWPPPPPRHPMSTHLAPGVYGAPVCPGLVPPSPPKRRKQQRPRRRVDSSHAKAGRCRAYPLDPDIAKEPSCDEAIAADGMGKDLCGDSLLERACALLLLTCEDGRLQSSLVASTQQHAEDDADMLAVLRGQAREVLGTAAEEPPLPTALPSTFASAATAPPSKTGSRSSSRLSSDAADQVWSGASTPSISQAKLVDDMLDGVLCFSISVYAESSRLSEFQAREERLVSISNV